MIKNLRDIIPLAAAKGRKRLVIAPADDLNTVRTVQKARKLGIVDPVFIGKKDLLTTMFKDRQPDSGLIEIIDEQEPDRAVAKAVEIIDAGDAEMIMQGRIDTATFLRLVSNQDRDLIKIERAGCATIVALEDRERIGIIADTYINNAPSLKQKINIINDTIGLANKLGIETPKIALLAAIEMINPDISSTLEAAILSKMAERGQIRNAIVEGPLDIDTATSSEAAKRKGLKSTVPGDADIYVVPDVESGIALWQTLHFIGGLDIANVLMGTKVPVILNIGSVPVRFWVINIALSILNSRG